VTPPRRRETYIVRWRVVCAIHSGAEPAAGPRLSLCSVAATPAAAAAPRQSPARASAPLPPRPGVLPSVADIAARPPGAPGGRRGPRRRGAAPWLCAAPRRRPPHPPHPSSPPHNGVQARGRGRRHPVPHCQGAIRVDGRPRRGDVPAADRHYQDKAPGKKGEREEREAVVERAGPGTRAASSPLTVPSLHPSPF